MTAPKSRPGLGVAVLLCLSLLGSACDDDGAPATTTTPVVTAFILELSAEQIDEIVLNGVNQTGRTDLGRDDWVRIAERVCEEGAWTADVQHAIAAEEGLDRDVPASEVLVLLRQIGITACPELRPNG